MKKNARFSRMGKLLSTISLIALVGLLPVAAAAPPNNPIDNPISGKFEEAWAEDNVTVNGRVGMRIHAKFLVNDGLKRECRLVAEFQYKDGRQLKGNEDEYKSAEGSAMATKDFMPKYVNARYNDFQVFMPYDALNMKRGVKANLRVRLSLYAADTNTWIGESTYLYFSYSDGK
jgi:hypothetical protein